MQADAVFIGVGLFKQSKTEFFRQQTRHDLIDFFHRNQPALDRLRQMLRAIIFRQFDIQPGVKGQRSGFRRVARHAVMLMQQADAAVIGDDDAVKAPALAQQRGQQEGVAVRRLIIDVVIGGHHGTGIGQLYRHLKRQQESVVQLAEAEMHRRMVASPFAEGVADIVFQRRQQVALFALEPPDEMGRHHADQPGIFAEGFFSAPPAHVARNVQHRRQPLPTASRSRLFADGRGHLLDQLRVPGGGVVQRRRKQRGVLAQQADQTLFMKQRRDAEPRLLHQRFLQAVGCSDTIARVNYVRAQRARNLSNAAP